MSINNELALQNEIAELRAALKTAQQKEARAKKRSDDMVEAVYQAARDAARTTPTHKPVPFRKDSRKGKSEVALVHATDWQLGKRTVSFGISTLAKRMEQFTDKIMALTDLQRADHPVKDCTIMFGGDMVEGIGIFPGQAYEVEAHLFEQLFEATAVMESMVVSLSNFFEKVS